MSTKYMTAGRSDFKRLFHNLGIRVSNFEGTSILIEGEAGLGKTTLAAQLATQHTKEYNQYSIYYTFDQNPYNIQELIHSYNFLDDDNVKIYEWEKNLTINEQFKFNIIGANNDNFSDLTFLIDDIKKYKVIEKSEPFIIVLDSIGAVKGLGELERKQMTKLLDTAKECNAVIILVREKSETKLGVVSEYLTNVILDLKISDSFENNGHPRSVLEIKKSRNQPAFRGPHEYIISSPKNALQFTNGIDFEMGGFIFFPSIHTVSNTSLNILVDDLASEERANFGLPSLDKMLPGKKSNLGIIYGQSILLNGKPGNSKTELAIQFLKAGTNEGKLFISLKIERDALHRISFIDNDFLEELVFIDAKIPFQTPAMVISKIRNAVERARKAKKPIRRAVVFGIGMLDNLTIFQKNPLTFLQVLLFFFKVEGIANILIDWPQSKNLKRLTAFAKDLVSTEIVLKKNSGADNGSSIKLRRKDYHFVDLDIGTYYNEKDKLKIISYDASKHK